MSDADAQLLRPGMWTSFLKEMAPEAMVETFASKGWPLLELSTEHAETLLKRGDPEAEGRAFRRRAADAGADFPQGHLWLMYDIADKPPAAALADLRPWLDLFLAVGVRAGVLHPGGRTLLEGGCPPSVVRQKRIAALQAIGGYLKGTGLTVCLENITEAPHARDLLDLLDASGAPNLGVCLDTGHLHLTGASQGDFIREAGGRLLALHIADNEGDRDAHLFPFGRGSVDWPDVVSALRETRCPALFNFEVPGENRCPLPARLAKLDYYRAVLPLLLEGDAA